MTSALAVEKLASIVPIVVKIGKVAFTDEQIKVVI
jgi:hypothetical protein